MCHHGRRHEVGEWMEAGCQNAVDLSSPRVFTWVSVLPEGPKFEAHEDWPPSRPKEFFIRNQPRYWGVLEKKAPIYLH